MWYTAIVLVLSSFNSNFRIGIRQSREVPKNRRCWKLWSNFALFSSASTTELNLQKKLDLTPRSVLLILFSGSYQQRKLFSLFGHVTRSLQIKQCMTSDFPLPSVLWRLLHSVINTLFNISASDIDNVCESLQSRIKLISANQSQGKWVIWPYIFFPCKLVWAKHFLNAWHQPTLLFYWYPMSTN